MNVTDFHMFDWNHTGGRGFSFEVQNSCNVSNTPINCSVLFDNNTGTVTMFGYFGPKQFPPDPDIAGVGVS